MNLHKGQIKVAQDVKRYKVLKCGRRSGKTTYAIEEIKVALFTQETSNLYLANTEEQTKNIIWRALKKHIPEKYFKENGELTVPNNKGTTSILYLGSWKKRESYRGMSFDNIFFDETDTMTNFINDWEDIFRPTLADRLGNAYFLGTPKITNPNLKRLAQTNKNNDDWGFYAFTAKDNPQIDPKEIENAKQTLSHESFVQEWMARYNDETLALFKTDAIIDLFTNTVEKGLRYLSYDPAGLGNDYNVFSVWEGWDLIKVDKIRNMTFEDKVQKIRELQITYKIPMSRSVIDGIGVGEDLGNTAQLEGIIVFKSSYAPFKTSKEITVLDSTGHIRTDKMISDFANLRAQCVMYLAKKVNKREIAVSEKDRDIQQEIEEELLALTEAENKSKISIIPKGEIKVIIGRSPDITDTMIMRAYFDIRDSLISEQKSISFSHMKNMMSSVYQEDESNNL